MRTLAVCLLAGLLSLGTEAQAAPETDRFALLVGSNVGDPHEPTLQHAEDDAARLARTLLLMGDFLPDQVALMTAATASELRDALIRINARLRDHRDAILVVFYSGHADAEALHLSGTHLPLAELKGLLVGSHASSRLLIVDACRSGSLIQIKGAHPAPTFAVELLTDPAPEGFAVLTSSAATEDSQESMALGSSFFTYYLNSGLMGAADQDRDGVVTLSELYAFASSETRAATATSPAGRQTPTFQFVLGGRHDLVITRPGRRDRRVGTLRFDQPGRYVVQRWVAGGVSPPVAEVAAHERGAELALPPGRYRVTLRGDGELSERDCTVSGAQITNIEASQFSRIDVGRIVRKGGSKRSALGFALLGGWRSSEISSSSLMLGSGATLVASLREDRRWSSFEARLGLERETAVGSQGTRFDNRGLSTSLAWLIPFDWRSVTLSAGAQAGALFLRQAISLPSDQAMQVAVPATAALLPQVRSTGVSGGPLLQTDFPLGRNAYARIEADLTWCAFSSSATSPDGSRQHGAHLALMAGAAASF
jgi:hypothetical protein